MAKKENKPQIAFVDSSITEEKVTAMAKGEIVGDELIKSIVSALRRQDKAARLAFDEDPNLPHRYGGLFFDKVSLIPDRVLKRIVIVDDLVSDCVTIRAQQISTFGRPLTDKYSYGYRIEPNEVEFKKMSQEKKERLLEKAKKASKTLLSCGSTEDLTVEELMSLPKFLYLTAKNAVTFGRFAVEVVHKVDVATGKKVFKYFRPMDSGTIFKAIPAVKGLEKLREEAFQRLKELKGYDKEKLDPNRFEKDEYTWVQVIEGTPQQAFTSDEMLVHDCFPTTDIELNGYPLTPIDSAIAAITTHLNITSWNKLYFQNGRAARGALVIKSNDVDPQTLADLKQQFQAQINDVSRAHRMPVFRVGKDDDVTWQPIDNSARDMEFQYLYEMNCRVVMAAFQISPEEVPGYGHLAKGSNQQSLSETSQEYKLEAARDVGIRPLLSHFQDFLNERILPLIDEEVAEYCTIKLYGLESPNVQEENERLVNESQLSLTYDDIMRTKEKDPMGKEWGGEYPLSPAVQQIHDKFFTVGEIREHFLGIKDAAKDPKWAYVRDNFWAQYQSQLLAQQQMEEAKKVAAQQQASAAPPGGQPGQEAQPQQPGQPGQDGQPPAAVNQGDPLVANIDQLIHSLSKNEKEFKELRKEWIEKHDKVVNETLKEFVKQTEQELAEIALISTKNSRG